MASPEQCFYPGRRWPNYNSRRSFAGGPTTCFQAIDGELHRAMIAATTAYFGDNLSQNYGALSIRYKCGMIRLTNEQWERIRKHFPEEHIADGRPGRKPIPTRHVLEAVLWILNTGAQWHMLPQSYPNYKTVHRRFQTWCCNEILRRVLTDVANELRDKGALDEEE
jgi:transposase